MKPILWPCVWVAMENRSAPPPGNPEIGRYGRHVHLGATRQPGHIGKALRSAFRKGPADDEAAREFEKLLDRLD